MSSDPYIFVGPGTGIAPMRSLIQECYGSHLNPNPILVGNPPTAVPRIALFYGCRREGKDSLFLDEWDNYMKCVNSFNNGCSNPSFTYTVAYSQQVDTLTKTYVTHQIKEHAQSIYELILVHNSRIYIAGSAKRMPKDVKKALADALVIGSGNQLSEVEATTIITKLVNAKRLLVEAWS
jgi:sulfite reductase (NADPH) flavoprotein alpha-component